MLEKLKFNVGRSQSVQEQTGALHLLVTRAQDERTALQSAVDLLARAEPTAASLGRQVQDVEEKATSLGSRLDELTGRLAALESRASAIDALDARIQLLTDATVSAERKVQDALGPSSDLHKHRLLMEQVSEQATQLQDFTQNTERRLRTLDTLSDQLSQKAKTLEHQQQIVEHAVVQSNRVSEMVWSMDTQIKTVAGGLERLSSAEQTIERTERLATEAAAKLATASVARQEAERDLTTFRGNAKQIMDGLTAKAATLETRRAEFDSIEARARALQESLTRAESRMTALAALDKQISTVNRQVDSVSRRFDTLASQAETLGRKQEGFDSLRAQLAQTSDLAKQTGRQLETLQQNQRTINELRRELKELNVSYTSVTQLGDRLQAERGALEAFSERMSAMSGRALEVDAKMTSVLQQLGLVDGGTAKAAELGRQIEVIDRQLDAIEGRLPELGSIEGRLERLNTISTSVDDRLREQTARSAEIDAIKTSCDVLVGRVSEAQTRLEAVRAAQARLVPMTGDVARLEQGIAAAAAKIEALTRDEAAMVAQERRFTELVDAGREVAAEVDDRAREAQRLSDALARATSEKDDLLSALYRMQARQDEVGAHVQTIDDQLARADVMLKQIQERSAQAAVSETRLAGIESRCHDIARLGDEMERSVESIVAREEEVLRIKSEVDGIRAVCEQSKDDLAAVSERRAEVASLRSSVDVLLAQLNATDERIAALKAQQTMVDAVQAKAEGVAALLDDVSAAYELLSEQREVVDQVADKVASLEALVQEARAVTERAQRQPSEQLERKVKNLKIKTAGSGRAWPRLSDHDQRSEAEVALVSEG